MTGGEYEETLKRLLALDAERTKLAQLMVGGFTGCGAIQATLEVIEAVVAFNAWQRVLNVFTAVMWIGVTVAGAMAFRMMRRNRRNVR